ncbi:MAG: sigma-70 family RNA polymerase sigma factor [Planctomycetes bacterium]|nr:sigma-70 family RNA polymerase sigma factor [Planctomycetota bacterium]MBL7009370.1 sigma-70 family RNA polymerase sigma factor [Planctomycetota bacterium]
MTDSDLELVKRCQRARGRAFEAAYRELYDLYSTRIFTICLRVTGNEEDALDAAQETLVTLARRMKDFAFRSRFSSWVYRIAVNAAIDIRRRRLAGQRGSVTTVLASGDSDPLAEAAAKPERSDPLTNLTEMESAQAVRQALASINPRFSSLLVLRYMEDLSYEEIADVLVCNLGTVKSRLNRAHAALREYLTRQGEDPAGT